MRQAASWSLLRLCPVLIVAWGALSAAPLAAPAQTARSKCGLELSRGVALTFGGPICGTDEGDDLDLAGEDHPVGFFGENGHDTVEGSRFGDIFAGGGGNDELHGGRDRDQIDGGDDSDVIFGGLGADIIRERRFGVRESFYGGPGNDVIAGGRGTDNLFGDTGDDVLFGGSGSDRLYGGPGDDQLYGGPNRDSFDCGPGNDTVYRVRRSAPGRSSTGRADGGISAAAGCERVITGDPTGDFPLEDLLGTSGRDDIGGGDGGQLIQGKGAGDRLFGGRGDDELEGDGASNQGDDTLMGGSGNDRIAGRSGADKLYGDARSPTAGPPGSDEIVGGNGRDLMVGGPGNDLIQGAYAGDRILAGSGHDVVTLLGGDTSDENGRVEVNCGRGFDTVVINPERRGTYRNCEVFSEQFREADFGHLLRPSPESFPPGFAIARVSPSRRGAEAAARVARARSSQAVPPPAPAEPNGGASSPSVNADGSRVAFSSDSANLVPQDDNAERTDAFVRITGAAETVLVDRRGNGRPARRGARLRRGPSGAISADGRFVAFSSNSGDLAGGVPGYAIFRRDLVRGVTERACNAGNDDSESPAISADGRFVVFESRATNLAGSDGNQHPDVYWCDTATGELRRVSQPLQDTVNGSGSSLQPTVSADGRFVAFTSDGGGLVAGDGGRAGVYVRDMGTGQTYVVDVPAGTVTSNGNGQNPRIAADGQSVIFDSDATDLPGGELNGAAVDVFRRDLRDNSITLISQGPGGAASGDSTADSLSADGRLVVFSSSAPNIAAGDANGRSDVFVRNLDAGTVARVSQRPDGGELAGPSFSGAISGDGRFVAFGSRAPDVVAGAAPTLRTRIYRKSLLTAEVTPVTVGLDLAPTSLIGEPSGVLLRRKMRLISGTARDNDRVASVGVALSRSSGGRCLWLSRGSRFVRRPCSSPLYLKTRLTTGLRFTLRTRLLPRGSYTLRSRAVDSSGQVETLRTGRNLLRFSLK